jgi:hypothetical protein
MKKKRPCKYCGESLVGTYQRVVCKKPACAEKQKIARREAMRKTEAVRRKTEKDRIAELDPRFCDHCGNQMTGVDNRRLPVCGRDACQKWWKAERVKRRKKSMAESNKRNSGRDRDHHCAPVEIYYNLSDDDFTHQKYVAQQKAIRNNGRQCLKCGELTGGVNYYCERHRREINAIAGHTLELEGEDMQRRSFSGVM